MLIAFHVSVSRPYNLNNYPCFHLTELTKKSVGLSQAPKAKQIRTSQTNIFFHDFFFNPPSVFRSSRDIMASSPPRIISCSPSYLPQLLSIYNHYVLHSVTTFHLTPQPLTFMQENFSRVTGHKLPFLLLIQQTTATTTTSSSYSRCEEEEQEKKQDEECEEEKDEQHEKKEKVLGYAYLSPYNPHREAYATTTELSIFLSPQATRSGFGSLLLKALLDKLRAKKNELVPREREEKDREMARVREIVVGMSIFEGDPGRFYERMGFRPVGVFERVGWKFGRWVDVKFFQLSLRDGEEGDGEIEGI